MLNFSKIKPISIICVALVLATSIFTVVAVGGNDTTETVSNPDNTNQTIEVSSEPEDSSQTSTDEDTNVSSTTSSKPKKNKPVVYEKPVPSELVNYYVTDVKVVKKPTKTVYKLGETIDLTGMQVVGFFSNGRAYDITEYVQIFWDTVKSVSNKLTLEIHFTDWSECINIDYDTVYVSSVMPTLDVSIDNPALIVGDTAKLTATTDVDWPIEWYSDNTDVAVVDADGNITAIGEGAANVYAVIKYNNGELKKCCAITVTAAQ